MVQAMRGLARAGPCCFGRKCAEWREVTRMPGMLIFAIGFFAVILVGGFIALNSSSK